MDAKKTDHVSLAIWAADCADHILVSFEDILPNDPRPRQAIMAARAWARGELSVTEARVAAFAAHNAARETDHRRARAAARSAGHAAATAHVATHAPHAAAYAVKAAADADQERDWQRQLPHYPNVNA